MKASNAHRRPPGSKEHGPPDIGLHRRVMIALRRRLAWALLAASVAVAITAAMALRTQPIYRASAALRLDGRTLPQDFDAAALQVYAERHVRERSARALTREGLAAAVARAQGGSWASPPMLGRVGELTGRITTEVTDAVVTPAAPGELSTVAITFTPLLDHGDPVLAHHVMAAVQDLYLADDQSASARPAPNTQALDASTLELNRLAEHVAALEAEVREFERQNAAALPELYELNVEARERANQARSELDAQIAILQERRMELDRGLRDIQRDGAAYRGADRADVLTTERLVALQSERAVLRGRFSANHLEVQRLGAAINELEARAQARLDGAMQELHTANEELARLERAYAIDHPDVVRVSHQISALEVRIEALTVRGLTTGEQRYIESLARERREIDERLQGLSAQQSTLQQSFDEYESRVLRRPALEQQYAELKQGLTRGRADHEVARIRHEELLAEQRLAEQIRPGRLTVIEPAQVTGPLLLTRPTMIVVLGALLGSLGIVLMVNLLERIDRRVSGAGAIQRVHGHAPLAEIPFITIPGESLRQAPAEFIPVTLGIVVFVGVAAALLLTGVAADGVERVAFEFLGR